MTTILLFIVVGVGAGILSGLFGVGGGVLIVPALIYFWKFHPATATGTSLGALLLPVGILGALEYYRAGHLNITASLCIAIGLVAGAPLGARIALAMHPDTLRRVFSVFLVFVAIRLWLK